MVQLLLALSVIVLLTLLGGLVRVVRGPTPPDRMLAAQLMGTTGVGVLLLLSRALDRPELVDVGLVLSLLAAVSTVAFARQYSQGRAEGAEVHELD